METPNNAAPLTPIGMRRRLLGIPLHTLAAQAGITTQLLALVERGQVAPQNLHLLARQTLARVLDISL